MQLIKTFINMTREEKLNEYLKERNIPVDTVVVLKPEFIKE